MAFIGQVKIPYEDQCKTVKMSGQSRKTCKVQRKIFFNPMSFKTEEQNQEFAELVEKEKYAYDNNYRLTRLNTTDSTIISTYLIHWEVEQGKRYSITKEKPNARYVYKF
jgi:hypothetical protein